jgi:hypothetical protein
MKKKEEEEEEEEEEKSNLNGICFSCVDVVHVFEL